jgi:tetratricopeptide (TPR) repeat protein
MPLSRVDRVGPDGSNVDLRAGQRSSRLFYLVNCRFCFVVKNLSVFLPGIMIVKYKCHLFLLAALISCSDSKETRMQRFLIQGNEKIREQEYEQAERFFKSALNLDSCFADALNNLGTVEHRRNNVTQSIAYYSKAIACNDTFNLAYFNRAGVYYESNDIPRAAKDIAVVEKAYPDSVPVLELKGLIEWKARKAKVAISIFRRILNKKRDQSAMINLGTMYTSLRQLDSAKFFLDQALAIDDKDHRAINAAALLASANGENEHALERIGMALSLHPDDPYYLNNKGYILLQLGRHDEALKFIDDSIVADPYNAWAYRNKGIYYFRTGRYDDALRMLLRAQTIDPFADELFYWIGLTYIKTNNPGQGCIYLQKSVQRAEMPEKDLPSVCR